jgi:nucleoside-diphosphate-sugar epimerase
VITSPSFGRVLVTGATGFIGQRLTQRLTRLGTEVYGVSRRDFHSRPDSIRWIIGDLTDPAFAHAVLQQSRPEAIFHLAAAVSGAREASTVLPIYHGVLTTTVNLLAACALEPRDPVIVIAGSLEDTLGTAAWPASPYAAAKEATRRYATMFHALYGIKVATARLFMVYGPGDPNEARLIPYVIRSLQEGTTPALASGRRPVDWVFVDDVVDGLLAVAGSQDADGRSFDLGSGTSHTVREVAEAIRDIVGVETPLGWGRLPDRPFEPVAVAKLDETRSVCGWQPIVDLQEGLQRTVRWYAGEGNSVAQGR